MGPFRSITTISGTFPEGELEDGDVRLENSKVEAVHGGSCTEVSVAELEAALKDSEAFRKSYVGVFARDPARRFTIVTGEIAEVEGDPDFPKGGVAVSKQAKIVFRKLGDNSWIKPGAKLRVLGNISQEGTGVVVSIIAPLPLKE